jgi:hypothetical protein
VPPVQVFEGDAACKDVYDEAYKDARSELEQER